jgi:uncharacterized protein (DUF849 family)
VATLAAAAVALPAGATWSATGIGRTTLPVLLGALGAGGHLRVDTLTFSRGRPVARNAELVERARQGCLLTVCSCKHRGTLGACAT